MSSESTLMLGGEGGCACLGFEVRRDALETRGFCGFTNCECLHRFSPMCSDVFSPLAVSMLHFCSNKSLSVRRDGQLSVSSAGLQRAGLGPLLFTQLNGPSNNARPSRLYDTLRLSVLHLTQ